MTGWWWWAAVTATATTTTESVWRRVLMPACAPQFTCAVARLQLARAACWRHVALRDMVCGLVSARVLRMHRGVRLVGPAGLRGRGRAAGWLLGALVFGRQRLPAAAALAAGRSVGAAAVACGSARRARPAARGPRPAAQRGLQLCGRERRRARRSRRRARGRAPQHATMSRWRQLRPRPAGSP